MQYGGTFVPETIPLAGLAVGGGSSFKLDPITAAARVSTRITAIIIPYPPVPTLERFLCVFSVLLVQEQAQEQHSAGLWPNIFSTPSLLSAIYV